MKKILPLFVLLGLAAGAWYFSSARETPTATTSNTNTSASDALKSSNQQGDSSGMGDSNRLPPPIPLGPNDVPADPGDEDMDGTVDVEVQPAAKAYKNADEALAAVRKGAADYDDSILEQFTEPGEDCTWCPEFYKSVRELITTPGTANDQLSYFGEILAISGRLDNVQALVDAIKASPSKEAAESFAEALELTIGKDSVVAYLGDQLNSGNDQLRESSVAAVTNQGSRTAAEILYKHAVERGDPDGYYSLGIGLGEFVPDDDSLPYLQEIVNKRDQYSHLAVKSLLNSGLGGLRLVMDSLGSSKDADFDRQMLRDAVDHVSFEDDVDTYLKDIEANSKNPVQLEFARKILEAFKVETDAAGDDLADDQGE